MAFPCTIWPTLPGEITRIVEYVSQAVDEEIFTKSMLETVEESAMLS